MSYRNIKFIGLNPLNLSYSLDLKNIHVFDLKYYHILIEQILD